LGNIKIILHSWDNEDSGKKSSGFDGRRTDMFKHKISIVILLTICFLFFVGCSKLTKENYDKIKMGMDHSEVNAILGKASECSDTLGIKNCIWGAEAKYIKVNFIADKVVFFTNKGL
jgi:hypothetical protein